MAVCASEGMRSLAAHALRARTSALSSMMTEFACLRHSSPVATFCSGEDKSVEEGAGCVCRGGGGLDCRRILNSGT